MEFDRVEWKYTFPNEPAECRREASGNAGQSSCISIYMLGFERV